MLSRLADPTASSLPRIWVADAAVPRDGALLTDEVALAPALALGRVLTADKQLFADAGEARSVNGELVVVLRGGTELRLGPADDLPLQLAVARKVLGAVEGEAHYVDVSVVERAVVG